MPNTPPVVFSCRDRCITVEFICTCHRQLHSGHTKTAVSPNRLVSHKTTSLPPSLPPSLPEDLSLSLSLSRQWEVQREVVRLVYHHKVWRCGLGGGGREGGLEGGRVFE